LLERKHAELCGQNSSIGSSGSGHPARLLAGLAGIPAGGKSTFTAALAHVAGRVLGPDRFITIGMDGWHLPNAILDRRWTTDEHGHRVPLRRRKGGPQSFGVLAMTAALRQLREARRTVRLPVYDRRLHDPVPDGITVGQEVDIILIEGNYLFCE